MGLPDEQMQLALEAGRVFSPAAPVDERALFAGRTQQLRLVLDVITQRGQHAVIFGERGVGKTSLANVLSEFLQATGEAVFAPRINCDGSDDFSTLWRKVFAEVETTREIQSIGFIESNTTEVQNLADRLPGEISPDDVRRLLTTVARGVLLVVIIDEFDRLSRGEVTALFADTIKMLSDYSVPVTLVIVGVADTVDDLIEEHESIERGLVQIPMPRMSPEELREIILNGLSRLSLEITKDALTQISLLSQGLPHYTHLLGLHSSREAIDAGKKIVEIQDVDAAIRTALERAQQSIRNAYHQATTSPRKESLYRQVLLACALADTDELGYFSPADVRQPMTSIMGRAYDIPSFARHLKEFSEERRGPILQKTGPERRTRYRFINPLMQPYITMSGVAGGLIGRIELEALNSARATIGMATE